MEGGKHYSSYMISPLSGWINRKHPLPERFYEEKFNDIPDTENWSLWVSIEEISLLQNAKEMKWLSLNDSIIRTNNYLQKASLIIDGLEGAWLDGEEQLDIIEKIGHPPIPCLPIYIISCGNGKEEQVVYIGKTQSNSRFNGGHSAALKLLDPKYDNIRKNIYRCSIWFRFNDEYIVLDWIRPTELAIELLDSIESQLIFEFKPDLNIRKKKKRYAKWEFTIHIQNIIDSGFLNDTFVWPK